MLAYVLTDIPVPRAELQAMLGQPRVAFKSATLTVYTRDKLNCVSVCVISLFRGHVCHSQAVWPRSRACNHLAALLLQAV